MNRQRQQKRKQFAQNFLTSEKLVQKLVHLAKINTRDTVIDIGAGRGIIASELARHAGKVIAIEKDPRLVGALRERFRLSPNVEIVAGDFLTYRIPAHEYKVFASIPYNLTAAIVRKLLDPPSRGPIEAHLILQKEPARKFAGLPNETLFSLLAKPNFEFAIVHHLRRTDFYPVPDVESVMLRIKRLDAPLVDDAVLFRSFVEYGFARYKPNLRLAYKNLITYRQWKGFAAEIGFDLNATPTELTFEQWLSLHAAYKRFGCLTAASRRGRGSEKI